MSPLATAAVACGDSQDHVIGKVLVDRSQAVCCPRTDRREGAFSGMSASVPRQLRSVIVMAGPERSYDRQIISTFTDVLKPVPDLQSAFAVFLEAGI